MASENEKSQQFLLKGFARLTANSNLPSILKLSKQAFPLVYSKADQIISAAAPCGKGRVVAIGHRQYAAEDNEEKGWPRFVRNIYKWLAPGICRPKVGILKFGSKDYQEHFDILTKAGFIMTFVSKVEEFETVDAFLGDTFTKYSTEVLEKIEDLIKNVGKGILVIGHNHQKNKYSNEIMLDCGIKVTPVKAEVGNPLKLATAE